MQKAIFILSLFLLFSCKKEVPTLNGASQQEFDESIENISKTLPLFQQNRLKEAVQIIYEYDAPNLQEEVRWSKVRNALNGKTAAEVFDFADRIAKEKGLDWRSTSSTSVLNFNKTEKGLSDTDSLQIDYSAIENAQKLTIQAKYFDKDKDGIQDGIMLFPTLFDETNSYIEFSNLPLKSVISIYSGGAKIYDVNTQFTNSTMGSVSANRGIFIPFNNIPLDQVQVELIDVEMRVQTPFNSFVAKTINVPFETVAWLENEKIQNEGQEIENELKGAEALKTVDAFLQNLGAGNFKAAFALSNNPKWKDYETFSSPAVGFGSVKSIDILETKVVNFSTKTAVISASYKASDAKGNSKNFNQSFTLENRNGTWIIINSKQN